jgi:signal transduction histidine kinase/ligand-binding sensor domain-containing protein
VQGSGAASDLAGQTQVMRVWRAGDGRGLPSDAVTAVLQTRDGFLWAGTVAGLVRFDGVKFTELKLTTTRIDGPPWVTALCEDSDGHLWIGSQQHGLFELEHGRLRHFEREQGLCDAAITSLAAAEQGQVWIGSKSGLNLWTGKDFKSFTVRDGLPADFISGVSVARSGAVWITTRVGMCRYLNGSIGPYTFETESQGRSPEYLGAYEDRRGNLWAFGDTYLVNLTEGKRFNYFRSSEPASVRIWSLCEGRDGRLWIGTSGRGLYCFEENRFQPVTLAEDRWPYDVRALCEDQNGNLWLGTTGGGLVQLRHQTSHLLRAEQGLPATVPTALAVDAGGRVYVGFQRGGLFVGESGRFDRVGGGDAAETWVSSVCVARDGTVWMGTMGNGLYGLHDGHGIHLTIADGLADDSVLALCSDAEGALWFGTRAGGVQCLGGKNSSGIETVRGGPQACVTAMLPALGGGLWLGTETGQLWRQTGRKFSLIQRSNGSTTCPVLALHEPEPGRLWMGTAGGGLSYMRNGSGRNWNLTNGLPDSTVAGIVGDAGSNLWLATRSGIYRVKYGDLAQAVTDARKPLICELMAGARTVAEPGGVPEGTRAAGTKDGLWFATVEGVLNVETRQRESEARGFPICLESAAFNAQAPVCLLEGSLWSVSAPDRPTPKAPVDLRSLEIRFTALNFEAPEEIRFRHKLEGLDSDWIEDGSSRLARYGHLSYGHYRFRVAARRADGDWQQTAESFAFTVPAPLYYQTWAICAYALTALALVGGAVRLVSHRRLRSALARLEQQQMLERERLRIARDMHDEMGSKLTKISFLSERVSVEAKSAGQLGQKMEAIAQASRDLLKTMEEIVWVVNPHNDTLENLAAYLSHYAVEYFQNTSIECELRLPEDLPHSPLSSEARHNLFLAFEEALNNVLKHSAASSVRVEMAVRGENFELTMSDNGKGFKPAALSATGQRVGNGLRNMHQRLLAIGGECRISSQPGAGTTVTMRLGLSKKAQDL